MAATVTTVPQFRKGQTVCFMGGMGTIKSYQPEAGDWSYFVEMPMGPEPEMGRIGYETTIQLAQAELTLWSNNNAFDLALSA